MIWRKTQPPEAEADRPKGFDDFEVRLGDVMRGERATLGKSLLDVQRELKIKANYIAAIENCDVTAFETQGFVAGYVRSYARYLGMDPDESFRRFCAEAGFEVAHGMSPSATPATIAAARHRALPARDPFLDPRATFVPRRENPFAQIEPGAVGSVAVLVALIGALGYGGYSVLQEVQRVQIAPVDQAPLVLAEIDPLAAVEPAGPVARGRPGAEAKAATADAPSSRALMDRLYRPRALEVPVLVSRDGPIAAIDPGLVRRAEPLPGAAVAAVPAGPDLPEAGAAAEAVQVVEAPAPGVEILAVRPSWVRVSAPDGTVLLEKILDAGERYSVPQMDQAAVLRAGNSGSIYFVVNGQAYGPAAPGAQVVKNVALSPEALTGAYRLADLSGDADLATMVAMADASPVTGAAPEAAPAE